MSGLLQLIQSADVSVYNFLNAFAGNRALDYILKFGEHSRLLKGGVFLAVYWFFWFRPEVGQEKRRRAILTTLAGALLALLACRLIADLLPFRTRPMYDPRLLHQPFAIPIEPDLVNWSAFPSDNATFFFALAFGMVYLARWLAIPAMLYAALWICLPRMFLGVHYPSDTVAGAAIGIATVWVCMRTRWFQSRVAAPALAFMDAKPGAFYMAAFLCSFEMAAMFEDLRAAGGAVLRILQIDRRYWLSLGVVAGVLVLLALVCAVFLAGKKESRWRLHWSAESRNEALRS